MKVVFLKESKKENRVSLVPRSFDSIPKNVEIFFQPNIGKSIGYDDESYLVSGFKPIKKSDIKTADIIVKLSPLSKSELRLVSDPKQLVISNCFLVNNAVYLKRLLNEKIASLGIELFHEDNVFPWLIKNETLKSNFVSNDLIKYLSEHNKKDKLTKTLELLERPVLKYLIVNYSYASVELIKNLLVNGHEITLLESNQFYVDVLKNNKVINELLTVHKGKLTIKSYGFDLLNDECKKCDVLVYTTTTPGGIAHTRITYDMIVSVKKNGVFVDLSAENGLCCEAINYPNDKRYPYTMVKNTVCLALNNIPSKFYPKDASDFTCDFILNLLKHFEDNTLDTIKSDYAIKNSMQTFGGNIVSKTIGESLNLKYKEI